MPLQLTWPSTAMRRSRLGSFAPLLRVCRASRRSGAALAVALLSAAPARAQQESSDGSANCPYYCKNWCQVASCQRMSCNPFEPADCPGSECVRECHSGVLGSVADKDDLTLILFGGIAGGVVFICCVVVLCYWLCKHRADRHQKGQQASQQQDSKMAWLKKQKAKNAKRAGMSHVQERSQAAGKTVSAKQIVEEAMSAAMKDGDVEQNGSRSNSRSASKQSARSQSKGSPRRGGSAADDLRIPSNRAVFRQIYEDRYERSASKEAAGSSPRSGSPDDKEADRKRKSKKRGDQEDEDGPEAGEQSDDQQVESRV